MLLFTTIIDIEFLCLVFSLIYLTNKHIGWYIHFTWYLAITVVVESLGYYTYFYLHRSNHMIFNLFLPLEFVFTGWIMFKVYEPMLHSKYAIMLTLAIVCIIYLTESITNDFSEYSTRANIAFSIAVVVSCLFYYYHLIKTDEYINVYKYGDFWVVTGLFIFYFVETASNFFFTYTSSINRKSIIPIRFIIHIILNFILYSCWAYSFICRYRRKISS
jgi:hypothetical protein